MTFDPRHQSRTLVDGADRAAARTYFKAVGGVAYLPRFESNVLFMPTR